MARSARLDVGEATSHAGVVHLYVEKGVTKQRSMNHFAKILRSTVILLAMASGLEPLCAAQQDQKTAVQILARTRVFSEVGPGVAALESDSAGRYYILAAPANVILIYDAEGKRIGKIPNANSAGAKIAYAVAIDLDSDGRLFVADRGANAVKIFKPDGSLQSSFPVAAPVSLVALPGGECAVVSLRSDHLVNVFDASGKQVRSFGDLPEGAGATAPNQLANRGRVSSDSAGAIYLSFIYLPQPTFRKYDRYGYAALDVSLPSSASETSAPSNRREFITLEKKDGGLPAKPVIGALGVDPATQEVWAAIEDELVHFDKDGNPRESYRVATPDGARIEPDAILVEPNRVLIAADPIGIFDFARPDKPSLGAPKH